LRRITLNAPSPDIGTRRVFTEALRANACVRKDWDPVKIDVATKPPIHPALVAYLEQRSQSIQNKIADNITRFAGSMPFIYIHML
jgi:hypothetical protein